MVAKGGIALTKRFCSHALAKSMVAKGGIALTKRFCSHALAKSMVAKGGIEPPTRGFSVRCSTN
jgi:hypothetical protein